MMGLRAAVVATGLLAMGASGWNVKVNSTQVSTTEATCDSIGALCAGSHCCTGLACSPVLNYQSMALEARCVVTDASSLDATACYGHNDNCFYNQQCCSGVCRDSDTDGQYTCEGDRQETTSSTSSSTSSTSTTPQPDDDWIIPEVKGSPHWGTLGFHVPLGGILVIFAVMIALIALVTPKVRQRREMQALGVDKLPPAPLAAEDGEAEEGWERNSFGGKFLLGWQHKLIAETGGNVFEGADEAPPDVPVRDYEDELGYVEIGSLGQEPAAPSPCA